MLYYFRRERTVLTNMMGTDWRSFVKHPSWVKNSVSNFGFFVAKYFLFYFLAKNWLRSCSSWRGQKKRNRRRRQGLRKRVIGLQKIWFIGINQKPFIYSCSIPESSLCQDRYTFWIIRIKIFSKFCKIKRKIIFTKRRRGRMTIVLLHWAIFFVLRVQYYFVIY